MKGKSMSEKLSLIGAGIGTVTLVIFCIYGLVYDYMDIAVALWSRICPASCEGCGSTESAAGDVRILGDGAFFLKQLSRMGRPFKWH